MQMSFANQFIAAIRLHKHHSRMKPEVYDVPIETEYEVARAALKSMGITIGTQTEEQREYAKSWEV